MKRDGVGSVRKILAALAAFVVLALSLKQIGLSSVQARQAIYIYDDGLLSNETYFAMEAAAIRVIETSGGASWWSRRGKELGSGLSKRINERRAEVGESVAPVSGLSHQRESSSQ